MGEGKVLHLKLKTERELKVLIYHTTETFRAVKLFCMILYDTIMVDISHYTFVQTHRTLNTKSEL